MTIEQAVLENLKVLHTEQQREALAFIESLARAAGHKKAQPFRSVRGTLNINLDNFERDLDEVRGEMWRNFPREEPK